ncbi:MAG: ECF transporter S component [Oscillospiraceae bacterium]|nr:ECF transporter S component [Oscillospiraceae bacterium]
MNNSSRKVNAKHLTAAALCLTLCMVLPLLTGQNQSLGSVLSLMHIPVLLCGYLTGPLYATIVGLAAPILRLLIFGSPPPFMAVTMCFELAVYGALAGALYRAFPKKIAYIYVSLILSMFIGRFVWGLATWQLVSTGLFDGQPMAMQQFSWEIFISAAFVTALPGIILHIVLIPILVLALRKAGIIE